MEAVTQQPVSIAIEADKSAFQLYRSGILSSTCGTSLDHGVLLVGYGSDSGKDYWKVKNSWGTTYGENGYVRLLRGKGGAGECGLLSGPPSFPVVSGKGPSPGPSPPAPHVPLMFLRVRQRSPNASCRILPLVTSIAPSHASLEDVRQVRSANMLASQASACTPTPMRTPARHLTLSSQLKSRLPSEQAIVPSCGCQPGHATALAAPQQFVSNSLWGCFVQFFAGEPL